VEIAFQPDQVPPQCRVFAHILADMPTGLSGPEVRQQVVQEAKMRGADIILIGQSRQSDDDLEPDFHYYGPGQEYNCRDSWCGWKYGFDHWNDQGDWVNIGFKEWNSDDVFHDYPFVLQAAFLRCH
jgi:hypothetical protein